MGGVGRKLKEKAGWVCGERGGGRKGRKGRMRGREKGDPEVRLREGREYEGV